MKRISVKIQRLEKLKHGHWDIGYAPLIWTVT